MRKYFITFLWIAVCLGSYAQGSVHYEIEPAIEKMEAAHIAAWDKVGTMNGYRIQIIAVTGASSKGQAESSYNNFLVQFPDIPAYITFAEPYFRVRVGNYQTRLQAYKELLIIQEIFPDAFIISDKISCIEK